MRWKRAITVYGCHAEGEYGKVVTGGVLDPPGKTMFDKKRHLEQNADGLRKFLLFEPRGAAVQSANLVLPSSHPEAQAGYVIMESTEYPPMSGSNTICTATVLLETGMLPMREPETRLVLEAPGGLIELTARCRDGKVEQVRFANVPAFVLHLDAPLEVEGHGTIVVDVAYGGMMFALTDATTLGFAIAPDEARDICVLGQKIKAAAVEQLEAVHPENPEIRDVTIAAFTGPVRREGGRLTARNTVVVSPGRLDRSPCGTGTSARLAVMHARGEIRANEIFDHESIIGTHFLSEVVEATRVGGTPAVVTTVAGQAWITSVSQYGCDPGDPFPEGYTLSDTWLQTI
ncbi:MAG: proline racemase family protein [Alphaproteobacteria bacterium]